MPGGKFRKGRGTKVAPQAAHAASAQRAGPLLGLAGALILACPQGYIRVFADEGAPMGVLLGKLGAANRTEAVARARQLGLIP